MESFIRSILKKSLDDDMIDTLLQESFDKFQAAFTSTDFNKLENYEFFEQLGDLSINKFIVTYMSKRFPQLRSSSGVGVLATLRILYGSKDVLSSLCEKYGFDKFIRLTKEEKLDKNRYRDILEDVFEAFFGALEFSIDSKWYHGMGYITVYRILSSMFDEFDISIDYETLVDAKTRLNELKDEHKLNIKYVDFKNNSGLFNTNLFLDNTKIGHGESNLKKNAQILAAEEGLIWLRVNRNIIKEIPNRYKIISNKTW